MKTGFLLLILLSYSILIEEDIDKLLIKAAMDGKLKEVHALIDKGANINAKDEDGFSVLTWASGRDSKDIVEYLLLKGADVKTRSRDGRSPVYIACTNGYTNIVKMLLKAGANLNDYEYNQHGTCLMVAVLHRNKDTVRFLVDNGAKVNAKTILGQTALMLAVQQDEKEIVSILIKAGANLNDKDYEGNTALRYAIDNKQSEIVKLLKKSGVREEVE